MTSPIMKVYAQHHNHFFFLKRSIDVIFVLYFQFSFEYFYIYWNNSAHVCSHGHTHSNVFAEDYKKKCYLTQKVYSYFQKAQSMYDV